MLQPTTGEYQHHSHQSQGNQRSHDQEDTFCKEEEEEEEKWAGFTAE